MGRRVWIASIGGAAIAVVAVVLVSAGGGPATLVLTEGTQAGEVVAETVAPLPPSTASPSSSTAPPVRRSNIRPPSGMRCLDSEQGRGMESNRIPGPDGGRLKLTREPAETLDQAMDRFYEFHKYTWSGERHKVLRFSSTPLDGWGPHDLLVTGYLAERTVLLLELLLESDGTYSPHWFETCADAVVADTRLPCDPNCSLRSQLPAWKGQ